MHLSRFIEIDHGKWRPLNAKRDVEKNEIQLQLFINVKYYHQHREVCETKNPSDCIRQNNHHFICAIGHKNGTGARQRSSSCGLCDTKKMLAWLDFVAGGGAKNAGE